MAAKTITAWTQGSYELGDCVAWEGVRLICTRKHYAGDAATHPWDPGDGWAIEKAATLWTPDGEVEAAKLRALSKAMPPAIVRSEAYRLRAVTMEAAGG